MSFPFNNYVARVEWSSKRVLPKTLERKREWCWYLASATSPVPPAKWNNGLGGPWHDFSTLSLITNLEISTNARKLRIWKIAWAGINDKLSPTARLMYIDWRTALEAMTTNENSQIHVLPKEYPTSVNNASVSRATHHR
jgi:hypothetical protein